jgi:hypothetical protein
LGAREPRAEELALPKSVESGNLGLNKAVIRWMSVEWLFVGDRFGDTSPDKFSYRIACEIMRFWFCPTQQLQIEIEIVITVHCPFTENALFFQSFTLSDFCDLLVDSIS